MRIEDTKMRMPESTQERRKKLRTSVYTDDYVGEYYNIEATKLIPFKKQARRSFPEESLASLASTIQAHGIRQPLTVVVSPDEPGKYEIVSGERRYRAALLAGKTALPCIILSDYKDASEVAIIENIQRENLHPVELMQAYDNLFKEGICSSMQEVAKKLGVAKSSVVETLNLRKLTKKVQSLLLEHKIVNREFIRMLVKAPFSEQENMTLAFLSEKQRKHRPLRAKTRVLSIVLAKDGSMALEQMKVDQLDESQKSSVKSILESISNKLARP